MCRSRILWLENIARLHEVDNNRAEIAEIHWQIYLLLHGVRESWHQSWAPRAQLPWMRCRGIDGEYTSEPRNFLAVVQKALLSPGRNWNSELEFVESMESHLLQSMRNFMDVGLLNLAERSHRKIIATLLMSSKVTRSVTQYLEFSSRLGGASDISVAVGMGLYYRVWYIGEGVPESLRSNEYIYRNAKSLHLSDFGAMLNNQLEKLVSDRTRITVVLDTSKIPGILIYCPDWFYHAMSNR